jgi:hypothetical protein
MRRDWGGFQEGEISSRATWGQGGRDGTTQKEGFQVSKEDWEGDRKGISKGSKKRGLRQSVLSICICVYNNCPNVINNLNCV